MKRQAGFTIVELMVTMVIFLVVIAAASQIFTGLLTQFKQQSKIAETSIEGVIGLDVLRRDIEHGGHGLPWNLNGAAYREIGNIAATVWVDRDFSDGPPTNPRRGDPISALCPAADCTKVSQTCNPAECSNPPGSFRSGDGADTVRGTDVLVIKAVNVSNAAVAHKWTYVSVGNRVKEWDLAPELMVTNDRAIVLILGTNRTLVSVPSGVTNTFTARYNAGTAPDSLSDAAFAPLEETDTRVAYGVADAAATDLRMPFNRADYYVRTPAPMPSRCAVGTGILYKGTVSQLPLPGTADTTLELPLLDCVADMQVTYRLDANDDGTIDTDTNTIAGLTAFQIREQLREVRVSILAHEGQRDPGFNFTNFTGTATCANCMRVGDSAVLGRDFNLATITNFRNYRWKVYRIVVQPINLR